MQPGRRRARDPRQRRLDYPRHPTGRARRRWVRAYDGGASPEALFGARYAQEFEQDRREQDLRERRRSTRRRSVLDNLRDNPIRNGLIGLAVVGTAAPIAMNRYQQALRTDARHEHVMAHLVPVAGPISDGALSHTWGALEANRSADSAQREAILQDKLTKYSAFGLSREMAEQILDVAEQAHISPDLAFGLVHAESSFKNSATSHVGAIGLTQLMVGTARWLEPGTTQSDLRDPQTNLRIGFSYLRRLIDRYAGDENLALTAYNRGPGTVDRILQHGGNPDNGYADFVRTGNVGRHRG